MSLLIPYMLSHLELVAFPMRFLCLRGTWCLGRRYLRVHVLVHDHDHVYAHVDRQEHVHVHVLPHYAVGTRRASHTATASAAPCASAHTRPRASVRGWAWTPCRGRRPTVRQEAVLALRAHLMTPPCFPTSEGLRGLRRQPVSVYPSYSEAAFWRKTPMLVPAERVSLPLADSGLSLLILVRGEGLHLFFSQTDDGVCEGLTRREIGSAGKALQGMYSELTARLHIRTCEFTPAHPCCIPSAFRALLVLLRAVPSCPASP